MIYEPTSLQLEPFGHSDGECKVGKMRVLCIVRCQVDGQRCFRDACSALLSVYPSVSLSVCGPDRPKWLLNGVSRAVLLIHRLGCAGAVSLGCKWQTTRTKCFRGPGIPAPAELPALSGSPTVHCPSGDVR